MNMAKGMIPIGALLMLFGVLDRDRALRTHLIQNIHLHVVYFVMIPPSNGPKTPAHATTAPATPPKYAANRGGATSGRITNVRL